MTIGQDIIGQDETILPGSPGAGGVWLKTHIKQTGSSLVATTYMVAGGDHEVFTVEVDLRPIVKLLAKARRRMAEMGEDEIGKFTPWELFTEDIPRAARKIGRSKLVKSVYQGARGVLRSKVVGGLVGVTALAFPPVGVPAAAAYAGANALVGAVDEGRRVARRARKTVSAANKYVSNKRKIAAAVKRSAEKKAKKASRAALARLKKKANLKKLSAKAKRRALLALRKKARLAKKRALAKSVKKLKSLKKFKNFVKRGKKLVKKAKALTKSVKVKQSLKKIMKRYTKARDMIAQIQKVARYGSGLDKLQAQKLARIIQLVGKNRVKLRTLKQAQKGGLMGMVINQRGLLSAPQTFVERTRKKGIPSVLYSKGGEIMRGDFIPLEGRNLGGLELPKVTVKKKVKKRKFSKKTRARAARIKKKLAAMSPAKRKKAARAIARLISRRKASKAKGRKRRTPKRRKAGGTSKRRLAARK